MSAGLCANFRVVLTQVIGIALVFVLAGCSKTASRSESVGTDALRSATDVVEASAESPREDAAVASDGQAAEAGAPLVGANLITEARLLFDVAACARPSAMKDSPIVGEHCAELEALYAHYRTAWMSVAMPYIAKLRPQNLPKTVVYPFGGGDLLHALASFPDGDDFTIVSLEPAGDVRNIVGIGEKALKESLALQRLHLSKLFDKAHSRTDNLWRESQAALPGELAFEMAALFLHGYEPEALRYFTLSRTGEIRYVEESELPKAGDETKRRLFDHAEIRFHKAHEPARIVRHMRFNLDDKHMRANPALSKYLEGKGSFSALTKAASHLLWTDDFSVIRGLLLSHMVWMISDTTCPPPRYAKPAGFVQDTYGVYEGAEPFGPVNYKDVIDFKKLFKDNPQHELPFRYGYPDNQSHGHMVITRKP